MIGILGDIFVKTDKIADYIPGVSSFTNFVGLFQKHALLPCMSKGSVAKSHYYTHLQGKSSLLSALLLIPVLGNILIAIYNACIRKDQTTMSTPATRSVPSSSIKPAQDLHIDERSNQAAICIQALVRGFLARKSHSSELYFNRQCGKLAQLSGDISHTKAENGKTPVWYPELFPGIIMKFSLNPNLRLSVMNDVRKALQAHENTHLIVPKAKVCDIGSMRGVLIEERLPINTDPYYNMWLYLHKKRAFDSVVRELVQLFAKAGGLGDLCHISSHPLTQITDYGIRFDNFPLYLNKEGEGCVGLIDLERMGGIEFLAGCQMLARIFPLHVTSILEEAVACKQPIKECELQEEAVQGIKALEIGVKYHASYLQKRGQLSSIHPIASLSKARKMELIALVKGRLLDGYKEKQPSEGGNPNLYTLSSKMSHIGPQEVRAIERLHRNPLTTKVDLAWALHPETDLSHPTVSLDTLATNITMFILQSVQEALPKDGNIPCLQTCKKGKEWEVLRFRSPSIPTGALLSTVDDMMTAHQEHLRERFVDIDEIEGGYFPSIRSSDLVDVIMKDLIAKKEIFSFCFLLGGYYWLRY